MKGNVVSFLPSKGYGFIKGDDGQDKVVRAHGAELCEEQEVEDMSYTEEADPCHAGNGTGGAVGAVAVIGHTDGNITEGGHTECGQQRPEGQDTDGGMTPRNYRNDYK